MHTLHTQLEGVPVTSEELGSDRQKDIQAHKIH